MKSDKTRREALAPIKQPRKGEIHHRLQMRPASKMNRRDHDERRTR